MDQHFVFVGGGGRVALVVLLGAAGAGLEGPDASRSWSSNERKEVEGRVEVGVVCRLREYPCAVVAKANQAINFIGL
jgi:hypothetical protein